MTVPLRMANFNFEFDFSFKKSKFIQSSAKTFMLRCLGFLFFVHSLYFAIQYFFAKINVKWRFWSILLIDNMYDFGHNYIIFYLEFGTMAFLIYAMILGASNEYRKMRFINWFLMKISIFWVISTEIQTWWPLF